MTGVFACGAEKSQVRSAGNLIAVTIDSEAGKKYLERYGKKTEGEGAAPDVVNFSKGSDPIQIKATAQLSPKAPTTPIAMSLTPVGPVAVKAQESGKENAKNE